MKTQTRTGAAARGRRTGTETREKILATAERLFAARGIEGVSVRAILAEAGVNVALAHRYFGSRDGLIDALLRRAIGPLNEERIAGLGALEARPGAATLEDALRAMFAPAMRWIFEDPDRARFLGHVQASPDPRIRALHRERLRPVVERFGEAVRRRLPPHVKPVEMVCRFYFVLGAGLVTALNSEEMARAARERFGPAEMPDEEDLVNQIVAFCAAGLRARSPRRTTARDPRRGERKRRPADAGSI